MFKFLRKTLLYIILAPYLIYGLGAASNQAVLYANNDTFPVRINPVKLFNWTDDGKNLTVFHPGEIPQYPQGVAIMDDEHCVMTKDTHLNFLADNFDFHENIQSIGDLLIDLGSWAVDVAPFLWAGAILRKLYE